MPVRISGKDKAWKMSFKFSFIEVIGDLRLIPWSAGSSTEGIFKIGL